jgi:hypothetical protein
MQTHVMSPLHDGTDMLDVLVRYYIVGVACKLKEERGPVIHRVFQLGERTRALHAELNVVPRYDKRLVFHGAVVPHFKEGPAPTRRFDGFYYPAQFFK